MTDQTDTDLLFGVKAIARAIGLDPRQVYYLKDKGELPTFKVGIRICARRSSLRAWLAAKEASNPSANDGLA